MPLREHRLTLALVLLAAATAAMASMQALGMWPRRAHPTPRELALRFLQGEPSAAVPGGSAAGSRAPLFTDVAASLGIDFVHDHAFRGGYRLPEEMGPGAAFLDYDNDGRLDIFIAGGGAIAGDGPLQSCRLYHNDGQRFSDVTLSSGAGVPGPAYGVAAADYDNDGHVDISVARLGSSILLHNNGDGTFADVTETAGVAGRGFGASAAFFDANHDGWLDLFVACYVDWSPSAERACFSVLGLRDYCNPGVYRAPAAGRFYLNRGDGTFVDATEHSGIGSTRGHGLGVVAHDFDGDGWTDVYVANDQTPAHLWRNNGDGTFTESATAAGCAYDSSGIAIAGMGVACEDLDGDERFDLFVTNIAAQSHLVLRNEGSFFSDVSAAMGVGRWSRPVTGFGVVLFDQDHDGRLDGYIANGAVNFSHAAAGRANPYAEPDHFIRLIDGIFIDDSSSAGLGFRDTGRGVAAGDFDGDGDLDLLVTNNGGPVRLLRNNNAGGSWLMVDARERGRSAIGAVVTVEHAGRRLARAVRPHSSYLCSSDPRVHFGLGGSAHVGAVEVHWPAGGVSRVERVGANQVLSITREGTVQ